MLTLRAEESVAVVGVFKLAGDIKDFSESTDWLWIVHRNSNINHPGKIKVEWINSRTGGILKLDEVLND
ncbi:MAG: hypothetical protein K8S27_04755 [Candidatus Omnitrophica bacterium]|nr:hypothetical protein [Candidatus Omnitrophota bacterium]